MATGSPTLPPCEQEIYSNGKIVCVVDGRSNAVERWVKAVAQESNARVDWHYCGGRAHVLHLGNEQSRERVMAAIENLKDLLDGQILSIGSSARGAVVREVDGELVLDDPVAAEVITVVAKHNCKATLDLNAERVAHFKGRLDELGKTPEKCVIVVLNVDDAHGGPIADLLMPGHNWQAIRDQGEIPFARGLAERNGIEDILYHFDPAAAEKLRNFEGLAVVVVDHGVAEIFSA